MKIIVYNVTQNDNMCIAEFSEPTDRLSPMMTLFELFEMLRGDKDKITLKVVMEE